MLFSFSISINFHTNLFICIVMVQSNHPPDLLPTTNVGLGSQLELNNP